MAHARRKFFDLSVSNYSAIPQQALTYIGRLHKVEREVKNLRLDERRRIRQTKSKPLADALHQWMVLQRQRITDGSATAKYASMAHAANVDWAAAQSLTDEEREAKLCWPTLQLPWEEYAKDNELAYKYTSFCIKYREWAMGLKRSMRQTHIAGEKLFVDYAGQTVPIIDAITGEITKAKIFVTTYFTRRLTHLWLSES